jgi:hypothetical protein
MFKSALMSRSISLIRELAVLRTQDHEDVTEEERPDRKPHYLRTANGRWSGHIIHPILASERCKSNMVKEAFALLAHIHDIIVHSNKSFAISMKDI